MTSQGRKQPGNESPRAGGLAMDCPSVVAAMPDLLFDPAAVPAPVRAHLDTCVSCSAELGSLQQTMQLLDTWEAPEPSPYWNARMGALLREEQARPARGWAGFRERFVTRLLLSNRALRPAAGVAALGLVLAVGGGTWLDLASQTSNRPAQGVQASNTVRDLQSLNENAQVFQQLSALDEPDTTTQQ
ncbi:hypothetical protein [Acidipila sp. EB88]|uniref:hypothetical protein n=1 Tax=Acidipila sp. EB88 TaxID=2305226 RepID=UPI000F5D8667|nr:hypothetical protein [Acidipila sp. EB88]